jgi:hypothetical protein
MADSNNSAPLPLEVVKLTDEEFKLYVKRSKQYYRELVVEMVTTLAKLTA